MRFGAWLAVLVGLAGPAAAEEPHYMPKLGTSATFRLLITSNFNGQEVTFGQVYRLTPVSSDGVTSESTLTPLALLLSCRDSDTSKDCKEARKFPNTTREGDLFTVAIPPEISSALAKIGKLTARDFLRYTMVFPLPGAEDIEDTDKPKIGIAPLWVQTNKTECEEALDKFFPLGAAATLTVRCTNTTERSQSRIAAAKDAKTSEDVTLALSFKGREHIAVPAADLAVASVSFKVTPVSGNGPTADGDIAFLEDIGISARSTLLVRYPNGNTSHSVRELIKIGP